MVNEATSRIFRPTANFENFKIHLYFICQPASQPAVRPGCARCRAPEISHNKGNGGGFTKMLFRRRFTHCAMAIPFILHSLPCSSIVYHESFEAKNLRGQCITQIFTKKLLRIPIVIAISARFSIATEIFHGKKVSRSNKKPRKPRNFSASKLSWYMVYSFSKVQISPKVTIACNGFCLLRHTKAWLTRDIISLIQRHDVFACTLLYCELQDYSKKIALFAITLLLHSCFVM